MGAWYTIGLVAGLGAAAGILFAGLLPAGRSTTLAVCVLALGVGLATGLAVFDLDEAIGGAVGGLLGGWGAATIARGASTRGGTRGGLAAILVVAAAVAAALAFVPVVGYLEPLVLVALGVRTRGRGGSRYAGLRILARD